MKKHLIILLAMLICLPSCAADKPDSSESNNESIPEFSQAYYEQYEYSSAVIYSGESAINPISILIPPDNSENIGAESFFKDPSADHNTFPTIMLNGDISSKTLEGFKIDWVYVYDTDFKYIASYGWLKPLSDLPEGEYVIVLREIEHGAIDSGLDYIGIELISQYECIFKLIVSGTKEIDKNMLIIRSGESKINPDSFMHHQSRYGEEGFNASGAGFTGDPDTIEKLPKLDLRGEISAEIPKGMRMDSIRILNSSDTIEDFAGLSSLPEGEHIVVISTVTDSRLGDESITEYTITAEEHAFVLIVP